MAPLLSLPIFKVVSTIIPSDSTKLRNRPERPPASLVVVWVAVIAALIVMAAILSLSPPTGRDTSAFAYVGDGILVGEVPYLDRWDHKGPVTYVIYALGLLAPGWWGIWSINLAFLFCSVWLAFKIVDRQFGTVAALFSVATLLIYVMTIGSRLGLTEHYALFFQFLALFLFLRAKKTGGPNAWECLGIGALGALSFLLRANLIGVWLAIGIFWAVRWPEARLRIVWSVIGGLSVLAAVSVAFLSLGAWTDFWNATIVYNFVYSDAPTSHRIRAAMLLVWHLSPMVPLLVIAWLVGIWCTLTGKFQRTEVEGIWPFVLILGPIEIGLSMVSGSGYGHYYLAILPVGTLYLGLLVWFVSKQKLATPAFLALILLFATVNYHMDIYERAADMVRMVRGIGEQGSPTRMDRDRQVAKKVKSLSTPQDTILVWGAETQIYLLSERDSPTRFFYQYPLARSSFAKDGDLDEFILDVKEGWPAVIVDARSPRLPPLDEADRRDWRPQQRYLHDPAQFQELFDFVESEYELLGEIDGFRLYAEKRSQ